jgi:hypothetical protein
MNILKKMLLKEYSSYYSMINNNFYNIFKNSLNKEYEAFSVLSLMFFEFYVLIDFKFLDNLRQN